FPRYQSERTTTLCRAGESSASVVGWETTPVPQGLRDAAPVERWRDPHHHPTGQTGTVPTAQDLPPVGGARPSNPLSARHGKRSNDLTLRFRGRGKHAVPAITAQTLADWLSKAVERSLHIQELGLPAGFPRFKAPHRAPQHPPAAPCSGSRCVTGWRR